MVSSQSLGIYGYGFWDIGLGFVLFSQNGPPKCYLSNNSLCFYKSSGSTLLANQFENAEIYLFSALPSYFTPFS